MSGPGSGPPAWFGGAASGTLSSDMAIDFEQEYGVNAGYVQELFEGWRNDPAGVEESWRKIFERLSAEGIGGAKAPAGGPGTAAAGSVPSGVASALAAADGPDLSDDPEMELLVGVAGKIATNMEASLDLPVATSVRNMPAKVLGENRSIINEHMLVRAIGKSSYTHLFAFALARALGEMLRVQASYVESGGKRYAACPST